MTELPKMTLRFSRELKIFLNENHDNCTSCGNHFQNNELTHLGYKADNSFIYACNSCRHNVAETVVRYGYSKRSYEIPPNEAYLWRYLDFSKFVSMLFKKALYFTKTSLFKDPFEGAIGIFDNKKSYDRSMLFALLVAHMTAPIKSREKLPPRKKITDEALAILDRIDKNTLSADDEKLVAKAQALTQQMEDVRPLRREYTFVNCWHENPYESDAMWMLYSKDISNAISIRTTYQRLYLALDKDPDISIGRINYIDFNKSFSGTNSTQWYKRFSFAHEKEVRAVFLNPNYKEQPGIEFPVDLDILIDKIYVSPSADNWFVDLVKDITSKYGLDKEILHSDLAKKPLY